MVDIRALLRDLEETTIAERVGRLHDEARARYALLSLTVPNIQDFYDVIGDYYNYHFMECVSHGGHLSRGEAIARAREILEQHYKRHGGNITTAFNDAHYGTNAGLYQSLNIISDALKSEAVEHYVRNVFDHYVAPNRWPDKVEIVRQLLAHFRDILPASIQAEEPERFAQDYQELIHAYLSGLARAATFFRSR